MLAQTAAGTVKGALTKRPLARKGHFYGFPTIVIEEFFAPSRTHKILECVILGKLYLASNYYSNKIIRISAKMELSKKFCNRLNINVSKIFERAINDVILNRFRLVSGISLWQQPTLLYQFAESRNYASNERWLRDQIGPIK